MIDISDRIHPLTVAVLEAVHDAAQKEGVPLFVVGATARDIIVRYAYQLPVRRATLDIDIAIRVEDWKEYDDLVRILISSGDFKPTKLGHRFHFKDTEPVDIVPFGPIAGNKKSIAWPPTEDIDAAQRGSASRDSQINRSPAPPVRRGGVCYFNCTGWREE